MQQSRRELNQRRVRRATQALVAASVVATAVFVGAAARTPGATGSAGDDTNVGTAGDVTSSVETISPPASAPTNSSAPPAAVSGGS